MICAALQLQGEGCYTLQHVCAFFSIKARTLDDAHAFAVVVMETLRDKLLKECYTMQRWKKLLQSLQKVKPDSTLCNDWCNLSHNDFDHCTACYTVQWSVQLVSQQCCETSCMKNCTVTGPLNHAVQMSSTYTPKSVSLCWFINVR